MTIEKQNKTTKKLQSLREALIVQPMATSGHYLTSVFLDPDEDITPVTTFLLLNFLLFWTQWNALLCSLMKVGLAARWMFHLRWVHAFVHCFGLSGGLFCSCHLAGQLLLMA